MARFHLTPRMATITGMGSAEWPGRLVHDLGQRFQQWGWQLGRGRKHKIKWEPSVRTRHIAVIFCLVTIVTFTLLGFTAARLLSTEVRARMGSVENLLLDQVYIFSQNAINTRPFEEPLVAIGLDESVRSLILASTNEKSDLVYCAIVGLDGRIVVQSGPGGLLGDTERTRPYDGLLRGRWDRQLWELFRHDFFYEIRVPIRLGGSPFAEVVAGIPAERIRGQLAPVIKLSLLFSLLLISVGVITAALFSNVVLWPLREVMESIEHLESESAMHSEVQPDNLEMQSISQRLRELGRRFAGNRTEVEAVRDQLRQVVGSLTERVLLLDRERRILMASPEAERLLSGGRVALRGRQIGDVVHHSHPIAVLAEKGFSEGHSLQEVITLPGNGEGGKQRIAASLQMFEDREQPAGALLTLRDFDTLQRLETHLDFATKLAALNRILAGVAHEVKNPLHAMVLHLELLEAKLDAGENPTQHMQILTSEVNRLSRVVQTFLDFTRPVELQLREIDVNTLVREVILLAADARAQGIDFEERYAPGPLKIKADSDLLRQALLNVIINGCQVMPNGGKLLIETERENGQILISITDHGPGIPKESREKIFNLYYTTKPQGSGIGLAQAFRAVQLHNGQIDFVTEVGVGTSFFISIPAS